MKSKKTLLLGVCAIALAAAGCAEQTTDSSEVSALRAQNADLQAQLASAGSGASGNGPENAKPGECYARVTIPASFETVTEEVVDREAATRVEVIPAKYDTVTEEVVVEEASTRLEVVPATYREVTETIVVTPEQTRTVTVPAEYETVSEQVLVREAYTTWKPGGKVYAVGSEALGGTVLNNRTTATGDVLCLVEVPAEYRTVTRQVLKTPASTRTEVIPAVTRTVSKRVVDQPASTREVVIPAKYGSVTKTVEVEPASTREIAIPATTRTVSRTVETAPSRTVWTSVLCDVNATPDVVRRMQTALKSEGFYRGPIDGVIGPLTRRAIRGYQSANGVNSDVLTIESARALGIWT